ncbi:MAG: hypothetical protein NTY69_08995 [Methylococcales bacterium]|nr:hypothetical protein [Methylococcales bacterium]
MIYLLDTNVCVVYLNQPQSKVVNQLHCFQPQDIAVCALVTHNTREFSRVNGLKLVDWEI